ncbi:MAG: hypothetical protein HN352_02225 [Bacteroidetes bacterium]|jgi:hypothetical protein|nr:hypothetical protein [Bacteroidota bacterium]MBT4400081.1 hypothetical protein [Bacteroidota bacterium]MBT4412046.1 hypothetical protein [Bacteroidota bacterium]MBT5427005.1 hypothetical protein [Bacteroidota bacterium]MBT7095651.1 hypothetical protein [Bacteroidota bacterium]
MKINTHIHTPYSFSAFESIRQAFELARQEGIEVLGINDFFVTDGYDEFNQLAQEFRIYPLFNVEFIGLLKEEQEAGIRVNDPGNPGRTYFCGKALKFPAYLSAGNQKKMDEVILESQKQTKEMILRLADCLTEAGAPFLLSFEEIKAKYAKELVRERHIAKALRVAINDHFSTESETSSFLTRLYSGKEPTVDLSDNSAFEGELRSRLLKAGGKAFVPEEASSFLPIPELMDIIIDAGGIPCYPVLLDDKNGNYTEFEGDKETLWKRLTELGVGAVELIPGRNNIEHLSSFVRFFHEKGFLVTFGTEHNTPEMTPLTVRAVGSTDLDSFLKDVSNDNTCVLVAHQNLLKNGKEGYLDPSGRCKTEQKAKFVLLGESILEQYFQKNAM